MVGENLFQNKIIDRLFLDKKSIKPFYSFYITHLILIISYILSSTVNSQNFNKKTFEHVSENKGSDLWVMSIIQDKMGYMWFGTFNGLEKYDGFDIVSYKYDFNDTTSISNSYISTLYEDKEGVLWVGTYYGLEKFDRTAATFSHYTTNSFPSGFRSDLSNVVHAIQEDKYGVLWIGTSNGLFKFNKNIGKFTCLRYDSTDPGSISHNIISAIYEDKEGSLWFGTGGGLDKLDFQTGKFKHYWNDSHNLEKHWANLSKYWINSIYGDNSGTIWMGTNGGLVEFNQKSGTFTNYIPNPNVKEVTKDNCITSICMDASGDLWLGTRHGLYVFDIKTKEFIASYFHDDDDPESISGDEIFSVYFEESGTLWIGMFSGGINKINLRRNYFKRYLTDRTVLSLYNAKDTLFLNTSKGWSKFDPLREKFIQHSFGKDKLIYKEVTGDFWFTDNKGGLYKKDKKGNFKYIYDISGKIFNKPGLTICKGHEGYWIGTDQCGLYFFDPVTQRMREVNIIKQCINIIYEDRFGLVWVAGWMGKLFCYNPKQDIVTELNSDPKISGSISGQRTRDIYEDKKGRLWFGTNVGLNRYDRQTKKFTHFTKENESVNYNIDAILEDDHGFLWLCTDKGISKFDPEKNMFKNFYFTGWVPSYDKSCKTSNGEMYFSGLRGLIRFHPDSVKANSFIPPIVITSFKKFDHPSPLEKKIQLPYNENFISFEFAALNFVDPEKNQYTYKMEGIDRDWIYSGTRRYASYTNLPPGEYTFRIKGTNNDGVWNEKGISVSIIITPPWWKTSFAYVLYSLLTLSIIYFTWKMQVKRIKMSHEFEMSRFEAEKLHEMDEMKSRFFANISHEFRTPLTLILGPVKQIINTLKDEKLPFDKTKVKEDLKVVHKNANRLLGLVNQLLDISKLESGNMKLQTSPQNIIPLLKALLQSFCSYAERKRISLKFNSTENEVIVYIDKDKIEKIITNVLSNALKFTPEGGLVEVAVTLKPPSVPPLVKGETGGFAEISIRDTGIGIPKEKISKIFDRFYQVDGSVTREQEGTGIGLSLIKELVELHKGKIQVESEEGKVTTFKISIPLGKEHLKPEEICEPVMEEDQVSILPEETIYTNDELKTTGPEIGFLAEAGKQLLLIVEDNYDVRNYISNNLDKEYKILEAVDGEDGLKKSIDEMPDLIISDVMMPKMDGFKLCDKLKTDERTSHIPIILLTAKASNQDKIEGLETGADDYIIKPFDTEELKVRIKNLIEQRKRIHEHFKKKGLFEIDKSNITSIDKKFLSKAIDIINQNISDPVFGVETFAENLAVSRSLLYKKILSLTDETPRELIKRVRITKSAELIEKKFGNLSEIALEVGFDNPAYFSECFKKQFGVSPSQYKLKSNNT